MIDREQAHLKLVRAYKAVFESDSGKTILDDLKKKCQYDRTSLPADRSQPIDLNRLLREEAEWSIVNYIITMLNKDLIEERPNTVQNEKEQTNA